MKKIGDCKMFKFGFVGGFDGKELEILRLRATT